VLTRESLPVGPEGAVRFNWGCGPHGEPGWVNADLRSGPMIEVAGDIRSGLPIADDTFDYVVSIHALPMIGYHDLMYVLGELRRVLRPGGTLRLVLPDLDKALAAYAANDHEYFVVPDHDEGTLSGKMITQLLWYGYSVTLFTEEFILDLLGRAGFASTRACSYRQTGSTWGHICELDNRERESLYVEAVK
jgi:SAM-dependent methyltransferase